ncbi:hypothetical protein [Mesorhizobium sp. M2E.F.Ca.ET.219.01.1.1]|uniref:hypothetical protein n=1 Tax=Mesorhizobium sp. M2E.F.Ca.ET.219.01.1.1 TaxID=2500530 RepID=UPI000FDB2B2C|nr:hypothetical protein [Mesorhizobium sp. M2E.F.Ca.ET.219.01.1.1]TGQ05693.1 hypothetical protein EN862_030085 [Mesorhizobium sp. M2E.F.Ca.ET.219.01.1.1]
MTHAVSHTSITYAADHPQQRVNEPAWERKKSDFVICVHNSFGHEPEIDTDKAIGAVFRLLDRPISDGEIVQVRNSMKKSLRQLWPEE